LRIHQENSHRGCGGRQFAEDLKNAENEMRCKCRTLLWHSGRAGSEESGEQQTSFSAENLSENETTSQRSALQVAALQSRAELLQGQQSVLTADLRIQDYMVELNDLLAMPRTQMDLESEADANFETLPKAEYVKEAWEENPRSAP